VERQAVPSCHRQEKVRPLLVPVPAVLAVLVLRRLAVVRLLPLLRRLVVRQPALLLRRDLALLRHRLVLLLLDLMRP